MMVHKINNIAVMQPTFLPWLGYFGLMRSVKYFVFLDDVQFTKQSWQSRNKIKNLNGDELWLSLPIKKHDLNTNICDIEVQYESRDLQKIIKSYHYSYSKTNNYHEVQKILLENFRKKNLADINISIIEALRDRLGINIETIRSSELNIKADTKEDRLIKIIKNFNSESYLSPPGSKEYLESDNSLKAFSENDIEINYFKFNHPQYEQLGKKFISNLSAVDCISNIGFSRTAKLIEESI
tara:strand:- start:5388 stop:6104 length:717 start_codon:yes stop_codon:yes gene_type:complete